MYKIRVLQAVSDRHQANILSLHCLISSLIYARLGAIQNWLVNGESLLQNKPASTQLITDDCILEMHLGKKKTNSMIAILCHGSEFSRWQVYARHSHLCQLQLSCQL